MEEVEDSKCHQNKPSTQQPCNKGVCGGMGGDRAVAYGDFKEILLKQTLRRAD